MTKREHHEIACTVRAIMEDCNNPSYIGDREIIDRYVKLHGKSTGLKAYVRKELVAFWSDSDPYFDDEYCGTPYINIGNKVIDLDRAWCWIRASLDDDLRHT